MPSIEILSSLICEDVRQESSGRAILIGAAPVGPSVHKDKETVLQRLFFYIETLGSDVNSINFRLISEESGDVPMNVSIGMDDDGSEIESNDIDASAYGVWVFGRQGIKFNNSGIYKLQYSLEDDEWHDVRSILFPDRAG